MDVLLSCARREDIRNNTICSSSYGSLEEQVTSGPSAATDSQGDGGQKLWKSLDGRRFEEIYGEVTGASLIPPERLLRALLLQIALHDPQ